MIKLKNLLTEAPIENLIKIGKWTPPDKPMSGRRPSNHGWDRPSITLLNSEPYLEKIKKAWAKLPEPVDTYLVKLPNAHKQVEVGEVDKNFIKDTLKLDVEINPDHITIFYTNNKGSEKIPMTPWILAHRLGHAARNRLNTRNKLDYSYDAIQNNVDKLINTISKLYVGIKHNKRNNSNNTDYYYTKPDLSDYIKKHIAMQAIGTMASCRNNNLRNHYELTNELIAQYIITGKITLKKLPPCITIPGEYGRLSKYYITRDAEKIEAVTSEISAIESNLNHLIECLFSDLVGRIYVM
jgi:hypothetical protein